MSPADFIKSPSVKTDVNQPSAITRRSWTAYLFVLHTVNIAAVVLGAAVFVFWHTCHLRRAHCHQEAMYCTDYSQTLDYILYNSTFKYNMLQLVPNKETLSKLDLLVSASHIAKVLMQLS